MNFKFKGVICLLLCTIISFGLISNVSASLCSESELSNDVNLVLDNNNPDLPSHFRKTSDLTVLNDKTYNLTGLEDLNISGSEQFSALNLPKLISAINTKLPIIDVDLRGECHGFINNLPVSWENEANDANIGLTREQILNKETKYLESIKLNVPITLSNYDKKTIIPTQVFSENEWMNKNSISYIRINATDRILPTPENIDYFLQSILSSPKNCWFHFHCKEGIGRTTTFMIFYDMMKNYNNVSAQDIISRQINLPAFSEFDIELLTSDRRMALYNNFYNYCVKYGDTFKTPYSEYINSLDNSKSSTTYPIELIL